MNTDFLTPQPHDEAMQLISGKPVVSRAVFDSMLPELHGRAFTITGIESANVMQQVRDEIAKLTQGATWEESKSSIIDSLEPFLGDGTERRAELLLRTHAFQAFEASNYRCAMADDDTTHMQYLATEDSHVRDTHLALNGLILPKNDPFWARHTPPWEWGCRCRIRAMNPDMVADEKKADEKRNPDDRLVMDGPALNKLNEGMLVRNGQTFSVAPDPKPDAFKWHPDDLRLTPQQLQSHYSPEVWSAFSIWARRTMIGENQSVWQWMDGAEKLEQKTFVAPPKPVVEDTKTYQEKMQLAGYAPNVVAAANKLTPEIADLIGDCKFAIDLVEGAYYSPSKQTVYLGAQGKWGGTPRTLFHELGHRIHRNQRWINESFTSPEIEDSIQKDLTHLDEFFGAGWQSRFSHSRIAKRMDLLGVVSTRLNISDNSLEGQERVIAICDTIMGITRGKCGLGHEVDYMKIKGPMEAFANTVSSVLSDDADYAEFFPNLTACVKKLLKL